MIDKAAAFLALVLLQLMMTAEGLQIGRSVLSRPSTSLNAGGFGKILEKKKEVNLPSATGDCKCGSSKKYGDCCGPFHSKEKKPDTVTEMVRSRFSALAYGIDASYMMDTTHPSHKEYVPEDRKGKRSKWRKSLEGFARVYEFVCLEFEDEEGQGISRVDGKSTAQVEFTATLQPVDFPDKEPEILRELSTFSLEDGEWLYSAGEVKSSFDKAARPKKVKAPTRMITTRKIGVTEGN